MAIIKKEGVKRENPKQVTLKTVNIFPKFNKKEYFSQLRKSIAKSPLGQVPKAFGGMQRKFSENQGQQAQNLSTGIRKRIGGQPLSQGEQESINTLNRGVAGFASPIQGSVGSPVTPSSSLNPIIKEPFKPNTTPGQRFGALKQLLQTDPTKKTSLDFLKGVLDDDIINMLKSL